MRQKLSDALNGIRDSFITEAAQAKAKKKPYWLGTVAAVLAVVLLALVLSCLFAWVPVLNSLSTGLAIVICTVTAAAICALLFPVEEKEAAQ